MIEEVTIVDPETNPEESECGCEMVDQLEPKRGFEQDIPRRKCLSLEERREATRVEMLEERRKK